MTATEFWDLIETARRVGGQDCHRQAETLADRLSRQPREEIFSFAGHLAHFLRQSYTPHLWCVAYVAMGGCSDDGFDYFRAWLVLEGAETFHNALTDPDSLLPAFDGLREAGKQPQCEEMLSVPQEAYLRHKANGDPAKANPALAEACFSELAAAVPSEPLPDLAFDWAEDDEDSMRKICPNVFEKHWENPFD